MLKVVVYDCGYGGEIFADRLEAELPVIKVIRVIDWRNAEKIQADPKDARKIAKADLRPYIGRVDLIILANHLLTLTSLKHFRRKYKNQRFIGLTLRKPTSPPKESTIILTTKAITRTISYYNFILHLKKRVKIFILDTWPSKIDDGELTEQEIRQTFSDVKVSNRNSQEIFLICSQFMDLESDLVKIFGQNLKIHDGYKELYRETCRALRIRGAMKKSK